MLIFLVCVMCILFLYVLLGKRRSFRKIAGILLCPVSVLSLLSYFTLYTQSGGFDAGNELVQCGIPVLGHAIFFVFGLVSFLWLRKAPPKS